MWEIKIEFPEICQFEITKLFKDLKNFFYNSIKFSVTDINKILRNSENSTSVQS